jgi:hypothetical protein
VATDPGGDADAGDDELVGEPIERREDRHLLTGDVRDADGCVVAFHRSQYGNARVEAVDAAAEAVEGVLDVYYGSAPEDTRGLEDATFFS